MVDESMSTRGAGRTTWHLWVVGVLSLLWNGYGAYDYTMTNLKGDAYLREMAQGMKWSPAQIDAYLAYYNAMPAWMTAVWAIGVWGAVLGSLLLLLRRKWAVHAFAASLLAFVLSVIYTYLLSNGAEVSGSMGMIMQGVIFVAALFFLLYASRMAKRGVLR